MAKKKVTKSAKRKVARKRPAKKTMAMKHKNCEMWGSMALIKLSAMSFILFLITVWPAAMSVVHSIHWGWFLAAWLILGIAAMKKHCM